MFHFGVSNIRRLKSAQSFDLKKINILVGRNSSGKSTFLRSLPLLKQSMVTRTSAPILWFGDFVDFGDFENSVSDHQEDGSIKFTFGLDELKLEAVPSSRFEYLYYYHYVRNFSDFLVRGIKSEVSIVKFKNKTRISNIKIHIGDKKDVCDISISENMKVSSIFFNGDDITYLMNEFDFFIQGDSILPYLNMVNKKRAENFRPSPDVNHIVIDSLSKDPFFNLREKILEILNKRINKKVSKENRNLYAYILSVSYPINYEKILLLRGVFSTQSWKKFIDYMSSSEGEEELKEINKFSFLIMISVLTRSISNCISPILSSILYIGPARAKSDRYYRYQDLSVSEIDPNGENFPMFLNSLSETQLGKFSDWVKELFGYGIKINRQSGHININLTYDKETVNIIDTGYGVSQILPVLGQIWWSFHRKTIRGESNSQNTILAIEQPELHLHPAHQALLADALASGVTLSSENNDRFVSYVIETHSEAMINKIGDLIFRKK